MESAAGLPSGHGRRRRGSSTATRGKLSVARPGPGYPYGYIPLVGESLTPADIPHYEPMLAGPHLTGKFRRSVTLSPRTPVPGSGMRL